MLKLQEELAEIRGTSEVLNRELKARRVQLSEEQQKIARLRGDLSALRGQYESSRKDAEVANEIEGRLVSAQQELTEEMKRLLGAQFRAQRHRRSAASRSTASTSSSSSTPRAAWRTTPGR